VNGVIRQIQSSFPRTTLYTEAKDQNTLHLTRKKILYTFVLIAMNGFINPKQIETLGLLKESYIYYLVMFGGIAMLTNDLR
tara:strand:- start:1358 stop:1600 length:243 start_codon:yes stop_codon:yes gene_type:complete